MARRVETYHDRVSLFKALARQVRPARPGYFWFVTRGNSPGSYLTLTLCFHVLFAAGYLVSGPPLFRNGFVSPCSVPVAVAVGRSALRRSPLKFDGPICVA